jgi:hypothetical protein
METMGRIHVSCAKCYRSSPSVPGPLEGLRADEELRALGWTVRPDGERLCPICSARVSTLPPPPGVTA